MRSRQVSPRPTTYQKLGAGFAFLSLASWIAENRATDLVTTSSCLAALTLSCRLPKSERRIASL